MAKKGKSIYIRVYYWSNNQYIKFTHIIKLQQYRNLYFILIMLMFGGECFCGSTRKEEIILHQAYRYIRVMKYYALKTVIQHISK